MAEPRNISDRELVVATLKDPNAFAALVNRYEEPLLRYIHRLGFSDAELAKDILQESFIKAYVNLNDYDQSLSFSAWMYRIVHNETISNFRKLKNRPQSLEHESDTGVFERIADDLDIEAETEARLREKQIQKALSGLDREYRDVLVLRFFEHKSYTEIGDILQMPEGTVATYLNRGKAELKKRLQKSKSLDIL